MTDLIDNIGDTNSHVSSIRATNLAQSPPTTLNLANLRKEPERLRGEVAKIQSILEELYRTNYVVFIENLECMRYIQNRGKKIYHDLELLGKDVEGMRTDGKRIQSQAQDLITDLKRNRQTLHYHLQLVELLEVPQLLDACIRNNLFEEATDIVAFANSLERRHLVRYGYYEEGRKRLGGRGNSLSISSHTSVSAVDGADSSYSYEKEAKHCVIIAGLLQDVRSLEHELRRRLVAQLRLPIQLPRCLQLISWLRKLDGLMLEEIHLPDRTKPTDEERLALEYRLQLEFLEAKDALLQSLEDDSHSLTNKEAAQQLMDLIERNRTHWFEIVTQYRAIFADEVQGKTPGSGGLSPSQTLATWLLKRITVFLSQLESGLLQVIDGASFLNVMEQTIFFSSSLGRIGGDFRELVLPVFDAGIRNMAHVHWAGAVDELAAMLERCASAKSDLGSQPHFVSSTMAYYLPNSSNNNNNNQENQADPLSPPLSILNHPPLAQMTNLFLHSFNQLRQCTPCAMVSELDTLFFHVYLPGMVKILAGHRSVVAEDKATQYKLLCQEARQVVFPYLITCFSCLMKGGNSEKALQEKDRAVVKLRMTEIDMLWASSLEMLAE